MDFDKFQNGLRDLAKNLESDYQQLVESSLDESTEDEKLLSKMNMAMGRIVGFLMRLSDIADEYKKDITAIETEGEPLSSASKTLEALTSIANKLDRSEDLEMQKCASVLDEILLTLCAPKSAVAQANAKTEEEINRLRAKYRDQHREKLYNTRTRESFDKMNQKSKVQDAIKKQVKNFRPLEAPLQTRYCPDHPGVGMGRIADAIYQCALDYKIYNFETGFSTMKGNNIPGGSVERQVPDWGQYDPGHHLFDSRESMMTRFTEAQPEVVKTAQAIPQEGVNYWLVTPWSTDPTRQMHRYVIRYLPDVAEQKEEIKRQLAGKYGPLVEQAAWEEVKQASEKKNITKLAQSLDEEALDKFVQHTAESLELENFKKGRATDEVKIVLERFEDDLFNVLEDLVKEYPPNGERDADDLFEADAPYLVLQTILGAGVGIWDGRWDHLYDSKMLRPQKGEVYKYLLDRLSPHINNIESAFVNAAYETAGEKQETNGNGHSDTPWFGTKIEPI